MREHAGKFLLVIFAGTIVGWFARGTLRDHTESSSLDKPTVINAPPLKGGQFSATSQSSLGTTAGSSAVERKPAENTAMVAAHNSAAVLGINHLPSGAAKSGDSLASPASGADSDVHLPHPDSDNGTQRTPLQDLLNSSSIGCTFGAGNSAEWPNGKIRVGTSAWQGGPVNFESIDIGAGTAQMIGSGVTRMQNASVGVTVAPTDGGLNFSGIVGHGTLVVTTVFSGLDAAGHHIAVISSHGLIGLESAQFYGTCDTVLQSGA